MIVTHKFTMDLTRKGELFHIDAVQGDVNTRAVEFTLTEGRTAFQVPAGTAAAVRFRKKDGTGGVYSVMPDGSPAYSISGNTVTVYLAPQVLTCSGGVTAAVALTNGGDVLGIFPIRIWVVQDPSAGAVVSENYFNYDSLEAINTALTGFSSAVGALREIDAELRARIELERARINELARLEAGSTTGDAELADIRVGFDAKPYDNAGTAVRAQAQILYDEIKARVASLHSGKIEYDIGPVTIGRQILAQTGEFVERDSVKLGATEHFIPMHIGETYTVSSTEARFNLYYYDQNKNYIGTLYEDDFTRTDTVEIVNTQYHYVRIGSWRSEAMTQEHFDTISFGICVSGDTLGALREKLGDLSELETNVKTDLVAAINEQQGKFEENLAAHKQLLEEIKVRVASVQNGKVEYDIGAVTIGGQVMTENGVYRVTESLNMGATEHLIPLHIGETYTVSSTAARFNLYFYDQNMNYTGTVYTDNVTRADTVVFTNTGYYYARIGSWCGTGMSQAHFDTISFGICVSGDTLGALREKLGDLNALKTDAQTDLVAAINEQYAKSQENLAAHKQLLEEIKVRVASVQNGKVEYDIGAVTIGGQVMTENGVYRVTESLNMGATEHLIPLHIGETYTVSSTAARFNLYFYDENKNYIDTLYADNVTRADTAVFTNTDYYYARIGSWCGTGMSQAHFDTISFGICTEVDSFASVQEQLTTLDKRVKMNGWIDTKAPVNIDTTAGTLTFGSNSHVVCGDRKINVGSTVHDISSLMGAFVYFDPNTKTLVAKDSGGCIYLGALWRPAHCMDLHITREKLLIDGMPITYTGKFYGKKLNCLGDSMTYGTGTTKIYHEWLPQLCGFDAVRNYGLGGSSISPKVDDLPTWEAGIASFYERYAAMDDDADAVLVFGGINDFGTGRTLGTLEDTGTDTFYGAMKALCEGLIAKYPTGSIYVFSNPQGDYINRPPHNLGGTAWEGNTQGYNRKGHRMKDYTNAMQEVCAVYGIPFCSLTDNTYWGLSGVLGDNNGTSGAYGSDALHPNEEGHKRIAFKVAGFLNAN